MLTVIGYRAFYGCGLESFKAPFWVREIGDLAFGACRSLRDFQLSEKIWRLGWLCFWNTTIPNMTIPQRVKMTPE